MCIIAMQIYCVAYFNKIIFMYLICVSSCFAKISIMLSILLWSMLKRIPQKKTLHHSFFRSSLPKIQDPQKSHSTYIFYISFLRHTHKKKTHLREKHIFYVFTLATIIDIKKKYRRQCYVAPISSAQLILMPFAHFDLSLFCFFLSTSPDRADPDDPGAAHQPDEAGGRKSVVHLRG